MQLIFLRAVIDYQVEHSKRFFIFLNFHGLAFPLLMDQLPSGSNYDQIWTRYICTSSRSSWFCLQNIIKLPIGKMNIEYHGSYSILHCFRCTANRTGAAAYRFGCLVFQQHKTLHVPSLIILDSPTLSLTSIVVNKKCLFHQTFGHLP